MKRFISFVIAYAALAAASCTTAETRHPGSAASLEVSPENLSGDWINESMGLRLTLGENGDFVWKQGDVLEEGGYSISGNILYLSVTSVKTTPYEVLSLTSDTLALRDPRGGVAYLERPAGAEGAGPPEGAAAAQQGGEEPGSTGTPGPPPGQPSLPAVAIDMKYLYGSWYGPYGIELFLKKDGSFTWRQPDYEMQGGFSVQEGSLNLEVEGNPTYYRILSLTPDKMIITDPEQNEIALAKRYIKISPVTGSGKAAPEISPGPSTEDLLSDDKSIFTVALPEEWEAEPPKNCPFPCMSPTVLKDKAGRKIHLLQNTFIAKAEQGAFGTLVPHLDAMMGEYSENREKIVDPVGSMNGMEVFSRRFKGGTQDGKKYMVARIIGVHCQDYLILGAVVTVAVKKVYKSSKLVMNSIIESMNFSTGYNNELAGDLTGTWTGSSKDTSSFLSLKSKHLFIFYPGDSHTGGKFTHVLVSDDFMPDQKSVIEAAAGPASEKGVYRVIRGTVILDYGSSVESYAAKYDGSFFYLDSLVLKKVVP
jgi:hypothetical protein